MPDLCPTNHQSGEEQPTVQEAEPQPPMEAAKVMLITILAQVQGFLKTVVDFGEYFDKKQIHLKPSKFPESSKDIGIYCKFSGAHREHLRGHCWTSTDQAPAKPTSFFFNPFLLSSCIVGNRATPPLLQACYQPLQTEERKSM